MNLLLLRADELDEQGQAHLTGPRAAHLQDVLAVSVGTRVRAGIIGGAMGHAEVMGLSGDGVTIRCLCQEPPPAMPRVDLLLALPRPKVLKRLYSPLCQLGLGRLILCGAARVERCYFDAHAVRREHAHAEFLDALEQVRDTRVPGFTVERSLRAGLAAAGPADPVTARLLAHPVDGAPAPAQVITDRQPARVLVAVGPEGGWTAEELDLLTRHGFLPVSMGARTLRSDVACVALLALVHDALRG